MGIFFYMSCYKLLSNGVLYQWGFSFVGFLSAVVIASATINPAPFFRWILEMRWLRWIGKISYGLYLWHVPFVQILNKYPLSPMERAVTMLIATFTVATISYYYLETPFLRLKSRVGYPAIKPTQESLPRLTAKYFTR
jgi:peptidoglycan/LPS O-acetylase OafA/YrhL